MRVRFVRLFVSALFVATFALAQGDAEGAIRESFDRWAASFNEGDLQTVGDLYTEDAVLMDAFGRFEGREPIREALASNLPLPPGEITIHPRTDDVEIVGDDAYSMGTYVVSAPDGSTMLEGNWTVISKLVDGEWKIYRHVNSMLMPEPPPAADVREAAYDLVDRWAEHYNQGDIRSVADLYTEDAIVVHANGRADEGREAIYEGLAATHARMPEGGTIEVTTEEAEVLGDTAYGMGTYAFSAPDGSVLMQGPYIAVSKLVDGEWKMHRHVVNALMPEPVPEADVGEAAYDVLDRWVEFHRQRDFRAVADLYTEDAVVLNSAGRTEGREAIYEAMAAPFPPPLDEATLEVMTDEAEVFGDTAYSMGSYAYSAPDGSILVQGTYVALFKLVDGEWKMHRHVLNMAMPAPEPEVEAP